MAGEQQKANLNRAVTYLSQRPEPKPISNEKSGMMKLKPQSGGEVRKMHRAGGYDYLLFNEKNWNEIHVMRSSKAL